MTDAIDAATLEVFRRARTMQLTASTAELAQPGTPPDLADRVVREAWGRVNAISDSSPARPHYECAKGCRWCCHQPVLISAAEAITIAAVLGAELTAQGQVQAGETLGARARQVGSPDWDVVWLRERRPCGFLSADGACSIHAIRPTVCRSYQSISRKACEDWYVGDTRHVPIDRFAHRAGNGILHGLIEAARESGRDAHLYELHSAVLFALSDRECAWRWAEGGDPFPGLWRMPLTAA